LSGDIKQLTAKQYCTSDADCNCGVDRETKACSYGNKKNIDSSQQCPDFYTGIDGGFTITCVANKCVQQ